MTEQLLFWVFALLACGGAVAVVLTSNVVRMAFWLVVSLGAVALLFFLLHADFIGAAQLLIYVGGTVVLLVFGVMLTATGATVQIKTTPAETILGSGVGLLLLFVLMSSILDVKWSDVSAKLPAPVALSPSANDEQLAERLDDAVTNAGSAKAKGKALNRQSAVLAQQNQGRSVRQLGLSFFGLRPDRDLGRAADERLSTGYLLPFEIVSVHLLVVLVGAAYLARAKRRPPAPAEL